MGLLLDPVNNNFQENDNMVMIATSVEFEAAHRQYGDVSKCGFLHGHNWKVDFVLQGDKVNSVGYLINFSELKQLVTGLDHKVILQSDDPLLPILMDAGQNVIGISENPSCENLAQIICEGAIDLLNGSVVTFIGITVWENDNSRATVTWTPEEGIQ
jgi:6-pyruvoyltetrahydropterin/6-carboxytetrahydropterin synthase